MLSRRLIACLDVANGTVVKGVHFQGLRNAGDPAVLAARYEHEGIDEVVVLDITATRDGRRALADTIQRVAGQLFIPLTAGGGVRTIDDATALFDAGADKVSVNSAALQTPRLITEIACRYGEQAVVIAIDARSDAGRFRVFGRGGTVEAQREAVAWAREAASRGAGEILLTSIDRDGTRGGFDCLLTAAVSSAVDIPVIASGGAGAQEHFRDVFTAGRADAALAASVFHFAEIGVADLKAYLQSHDVPMRLSPGAAC